MLFRIDRFAFTANNISYAGAGDLLKYWSFFPTDEGWGRLPTMGFADVVASSHDDVSVGTRCFGFYPMSNYLLIEPSSASPSSIMDGVPHRTGLAAAYRTRDGRLERVGMVQPGQVFGEMSLLQASQPRLCARR